MGQSGATRIPLLPPSLWLGVASLTLAGALAAYRQRRASLEQAAWGATLVVDDSPGNVALALLGVGEILWGPCGGAAGARSSVCGLEAPNHWPDVEVRRLPGFSARYDVEYLQGVMKMLCSSRSASTLKLRELAEDLANAICSPCPTMDKPVQPLVLARAEFYRFSKSLGGPRITGREFDVAKRLYLPAASQALALLAHHATTIYRAGDSSLSLTLTPEAAAAALSSPSTLRDTLRYYAEVACTLSRLSPLWEGGIPEALASLLAALRAAELRARGLASFDPDALLLGRFSLGRRPTLQRADPLPVAALASLLEAAALGAAGGASGLQGLIERSRVAAERLASRGRGLRVPGDDRERVEKAGRLLVEYSAYMLEASFKLASCRRPVEEAYAAARTMDLAARLLSGAESPEARGLAWDAQLLSRLAAEAAAARPPTPCGPLYG